MSRGRFTLAALLFAALAFALAGCGDSNKSSTASDSGATPTPAQGVTPATGSTGSSQAAGRSSGKKSKSDKSSSGSGNSGSGGAAPGLDSNGRPQQTSKSETEQLTKAVKTLVAAVEANDATLICKKLYSKDFVQSFEAEGGCVKVTKQQSAGFSDYKVKVDNIQMYGDNDAQVNAKVSFKYNGIPKDASPVYNFKREDGAWKYYIRTTDQ